MAEEKICGIYKIKNLVNGKVYIGQSGDIDERIGHHKRLLASNNHYNKYLQRSWNKYGDENFNFCIVKICDIDELNDMEMFYIMEYKASNSKYGYNMTAGGDGVRGYRHTKETRKQLSLMQIGKKRSKEELRKFSASMRGRTPKNISILLNYNINVSKRILCFNSEGFLISEYNSIQQCGRELNILATNIVKCLKGIYKTCGNFVFVYKDEYDASIHTKDYIKKRFEHGKSLVRGVNVFDIEGNFIKQYKTIKECSDELNIDRHQITNCCRNRIDNYKSYCFEYVS